MLLTGTAKHTEMKLASAVCLFAAQLAHMMRSALAEPLVFDSGLRPRLQWLHNDGYCAEVSAAMAGLKFGQYFSQYDVREIAAVSQNNVQTSQSFLVGFNDQQASAKLRLGYIEFPSSLEESADSYLAWVKKMVRRGHAVTITVFMNYYLFYGSADPGAGERDYDHIVSVARVESAFADDLYHDTDVLVIEDHGLWAPRTTGPVYYFNYTFKDFKGTREEANKRNGNVYTLPSSPSVMNFGIAHTGPADPSGVLMPVRVDTSVNFEDPEIGARSEERPPPMALTLTVTVSSLQTGTEYVLYRYSSEETVPVDQFNKQQGNAEERISFLAPSTGSYSLSRAILSSDKVIFRAVRADST